MDVTKRDDLRQESTNGAPRTTAISPGYVHTQLVDSIDDPVVREQG